MKRELIAQRVITLATEIYKIPVTENSEIISLGGCHQDTEFIAALYDEYPTICQAIDKVANPGFHHQVLHKSPGKINTCIDLIFNHPLNK